MDYFKCDSDACGAKCCSDVMSRPILTIGDYIRISDYLNMQISQLWLREGNFKATFPEPKKIKFWLGLVHDPCPFLSGSKCSIYETRPMVCADFPLSMYLRCPEVLKVYTYKCLESKQSPAQEKYFSELEKLMEEDINLNVDYFDALNNKYFDFKDMWNVLELGRETAIKIKEDSLLPNDARARKVLPFLTGLNNFLKGQPPQQLQVEEFANYIETCFFLLERYEIAEKLEDFKKKKGRIFTDVSARYRELLKKNHLF